MKGFNTKTDGFKVETEVIYSPSSTNIYGRIESCVFVKIFFHCPPKCSTPIPYITNKSNRRKSVTKGICLPVVADFGSKMVLHPLSDHPNYLKVCYLLVLPTFQFYHLELAAHEEVLRLAY